MRFSFHVLTALFVIATAAPMAAPIPAPAGPATAPIFAPATVPAIMLPPHPIPVIVFWYSLIAFNSAVLLAIAEAY